MPANFQETFDSIDQLLLNLRDACESPKMSTLDQIIAIAAAVAADPESVVELHEAIQHHTPDQRQAFVLKVLEEADANLNKVA